MLAEPELRRSCFYQATIFGLLALVGAATLFCTPIAGRLVDRRGSDPVNLVCMFGVLTSAAVLAAGSVGGVVGLTALTAGTLLLDVAMQSGMVANQVRIFALRPEVRSRLNTAYMTCAFVGGGAGSWLGARAYTGFGWLGVSGLVALLAASALARHAVHYRARAVTPAGSH